MGSSLYGFRHEDTGEVGPKWFIMGASLRSLLLGLDLGISEAGGWRLSEGGGGGRFRPGGDVELLTLGPELLELAEAAAAANP